MNLLAISPRRSGGIAVYVRNLLAQLQADRDLDLTVFTNRENHEWVGQIGRSIGRVRLNVPTEPQAWRVVYEQVVLPGLCRRHRVEVLHTPSYVSPVAVSVPAVVTICDMLHRVRPAWVPRLKRAYWWTLVPLSARRACSILTLSASAKADIVRLLRVPEDKVVVTPLAAQPLAAALGEESVLWKLAGRRYILSIGALGAHKNGGAILRSMHCLRSVGELRDVDLVLAGRDYGAASDVERLARQLNLADCVHIVGEVSDGELGWLYSHAAAYLTLSEFEGFGMTVLEAMSAGVPVVCSNVSALPEVAGDAALLVPPNDAEAAARALARVLRDEQLRVELVGRGYRRHVSYSWEGTARVTASVYRRTVAVYRAEREGLGQ